MGAIVATITTETTEGVQVGLPILVTLGTVDMGANLPDPTGNGGAVLGTDGTVASWVRSFTSPDGSIAVYANDDEGGALNTIGGATAGVLAGGGSAQIFTDDGAGNTAMVLANPDGTLDLTSTGAATLNGTAIATATDVAAKISTSLVDAKGDLLVGTADNSIARLAVGSNALALVADSTATPGVKWAAPTPAAHKSSHATGGSDALSPSDIVANPLIPTPTKSGRWVSGVFGPFATNQPAADLLVGIPYPVHVAHTLDRIGIYIQTSGSSGSVIRLGIYKADANGVDYTKVLDAGTIDGTQAAGGYSITISQALTTGLYLLVMVSQGSPVTRPILYASGTQSTPGQYVMHATSQAALVDSGTSLSVSGVSGALGSSITPARFGTAAPVVMGRIA